MAVLPELVMQAWDKREGPFVFATPDKNGVPNIIYATCVSLYNSETIIIADNRFQKTRDNILAGSKGSVLFITDEKKSFQVKGSIEYHKTGSIYEDMKTWNPARLPGYAAVALRVEEVYSGAEKL